MNSIGASAANSTTKFVTSTKLIISQTVGPSGDTIQVKDPSSWLYGVKLTIPTGALSSDTIITISEVGNPPPLPSNYAHVGIPIALEPEGLTFNIPCILEIPFSVIALKRAGFSAIDEINSKVYYYRNSDETWNIANITSIDTVKQIVTVEITHFSLWSTVQKYLSKTASGPPEGDYGMPQPGDLLFKTSILTIAGINNDGWFPGHMGIYIGENTEGCSNYAIIEAVNPGDVKLICYNSLKDFGGGATYMGARTPRDYRLTQPQRDLIVKFAKSKLGASYTLGCGVSGSGDSLYYGCAEGKNVKGPSFDCVGLAEAAYEYAGVNNGEGLVDDIDENGYDALGIHVWGMLTPKDMYGKTVPAMATDPSVPDTEPPSIPSGLITQVFSQNKIALAWYESLDNVATKGYKIYRNGASLKSLVSNSYSDTNLAPDTTYCYTVLAYDAAGNESGKSNSVCAKTLTTQENDNLPYPFMPISTADYLPLNIGDWYGYYDSATSSIHHTNVYEGPIIGGVTTKAVTYWDGQKDCYTSDQNGLTLYGQYVISDKFTGDVYFGTPLNLAPNPALTNVTYVSMTYYLIFLNGTQYQVNLQSSTTILGFEDVQTENMTLKSCLKVSVQFLQTIPALGLYTLGNPTYYWFYSDIGVVKQVVDSDTITIIDSTVNGDHTAY